MNLGGLPRIFKLFAEENFDEILSSKDYGEIVVGCVDNNEARRLIDKFAQGNSNIYWIDSGNERKSGQVICGIKSRWHIEKETPYRLPFVTNIFSEILDKAQDPKDETSCAERAVEEEQNIFINSIAAGHVLTFLRQIISGEKLSTFGIEFNIKGITKPYYATEENYTKYVNY